VGDVITTLNGAAARQEGLSDARSLLRSKPPGTKVELGLKRGGTSQKVTLVLADQI
jgi:S1-C subfamily serine protease